MPTDKDKFIDWLCNEKGLSIKGARDTSSRLKRVKRMFGGNLPNKEYDEILLLLNRKDGFQELSSSVKSQIKRAIALDREFEKANTF
jgi:hypothetical protein